tara:strand:- start:1233 stop:1982 length:750 start_codon:yes stop_codon:yes gene_type:complete
MKKNIIILFNPSDYFAEQGLKIFMRSKLFNVKAIIESKKIKKYSPIFAKPKYFYNKFPHLDKKIIKFVQFNNIKTCVSLGYQYRLRSSFLKFFSEGVYNLHPAILPKNKGSHSTFYTIINNDYIGSTLHIMNEKFDSGPIIDQIKLKQKIHHDAEFVFRKSRQLGLILLKRNLKKIYKSNPKTKKNLKSKINFKKNIISASTLNSQKKYSGDYIWRLIKAVHYKKNGFYIKYKKKSFKIIPSIKFHYEN